MTNDKQQTQQNKPHNKKPSCFLIGIIILVASILFLIVFIWAATNIYEYVDIKNIINTSKEQTKGQINAEARGYLQAAETITGKYIIPMGVNKGAYKNSQTWQYKMRDDLYNQGIDKLPPNDGEREIWWWKIRYTEYQKAYGSHFADIYNDDVPNQNEYTKLIELDKEILQHITAFPDAKPKDKQLLKEKYKLFISMLSDYVFTTSQINFYFDNKNNDKTKAKRFKKVLESLDKSYLHYKSIVAKQEKEGIEYFNNEDPINKLLEYYFREMHAMYIVGVYDILNELNCNNKYFDIFTDAIYDKFTYLKAHEASIPVGKQVFFGVLSVGIIGNNNPETRDQKYKTFEKLCKNQPGYKKYYKLIKSSDSDIENGIVKK